MAGSRPSGGKRQREQAKKDKAVAKQVRREQRATDEAEADEPTGMLDAMQISAALTKLHESYDSGVITLEQLDEERTALQARFKID